jgi:hypothetical protein
LCIFLGGEELFWKTVKRCCIAADRVGEVEVSLIFIKDV